MCEKNLAFWYCALFFLVASSSMEPRNSRNVNHESNFSSQEIYENLRNEERNDSTSHESFENSSKDSDISNIIPYEKCYNITCIQLCCPLGDRLVDNECLSEGNKYILPHVYGYTNDSMQSENKTVGELFQLVVYDPCQNEERSLLPYGYQYDYMFFANGSLYLSYFKIFAKSTSYCLAIVDDGNKYEVITCLETSNEIFRMQSNNSSTKDDNYVKNAQILHVYSNIVSIPFLMSIFVVYSILPELRNVHGFMLRNYSGAMTVAYTIDIVNVLIKADAIHYSACVTIAFFIYFCFLISLFWLNIMSFDTWWTFRGFSSLQRNVKQREKRKLGFYAIFAYGLPFIFAIISVIMDYVSEDLPEIMRPGFRKGDCWFDGKGTFVLYFFGLKCICIISSICLSISTALKIARYEKETCNRFTNSESKRYNDNKKWFNLYLKLFILQFIIMGINWSIMTAIWLSEDLSSYGIYVMNLVDIMQNFCTFIVFVWKKNIKQMILKRCGCSLFLED
ncbi:G-protein coupled receptor Mth2-like [Formica exsecta]|uniref:G-protein coupled receptor Mth2-like n=1 Tax=Formica exsecta TaxID=72781 RepID=UPI00114214DD|nr:G-protein coupled receptor Mth2-like [Formica exsecta]XP_029662735.1 G-protein coupled receptor Mth2-like [Formica exsecta]